MNPGAVDKLFDIQKIAPQIYAWEFESQRKRATQKLNV